METEDTTPPLSTFRRASVAATITTTGGLVAHVPEIGPTARAVLGLALAAAARLLIQRRN